MSKVKPLSPDRMQTKEEWLRSRRNQFSQMIIKIWPEGFDRIPSASSHFPAEFDWALRLIRKRRDQHRARQPKRERGGQSTWDETKYREFLVIHDHLQSEEKLKGDALLNRLGSYFGIRNIKKIQERLKEARKSQIRKK